MKSIKCILSLQVIKSSKGHVGTLQNTTLHSVSCSQHQRTSCCQQLTMKQFRKNIKVEYYYLQVILKTVYTSETLWKHKLFKQNACKTMRKYTISCVQNSDMKAYVIRCIQHNTNSEALKQLNQLLLWYHVGVSCFFFFNKMWTLQL